MKINLGCGTNKIEGYLSVDIEKGVNPDILCDISTQPLPIESNSVDEVVAFHFIEHITHRARPHVLKEIQRVLKVGCPLKLSYPEFSICAKNYLENSRGMRDFWRATLYGRQLWSGDYHVAPISSLDLIEELKALGFKGFVNKPEPVETYNSTLYCVKGVVEDYTAVMGNKYRDVTVKEMGRFVAK